MRKTLFVCILAFASVARAWVDDYNITLTTPAEIDARRARLITLIWGGAGFPRGENELVNIRARSPIEGLTNLDRVEQLRTTMVSALEDPVVVTSWHFIPVRKRDRLVIVHYGHGCPISYGAESDGLKRAIRALLEDGFGVIATLMPFNEQCQYKSHDLLFEGANDAMRPWHYFLEPVAKSLNYMARNHREYRSIDMIGLSGGGWTTVLYAAVDPRIEISIPVSGSLPLYLIRTNRVLDAEQWRADLYGIAGYLDLYVLGGYGAGRHQVQVLNRQDTCCYSARFHDEKLPHVSDKPPAERGYEASIRLYEARVQATLKSLGAGGFDVVLDDVEGHQISPRILDQVIRPALDRAATTPQ